jgi:hypothetical protein
MPTGVIGSWRAYVQRLGAFIRRVMGRALLNAQGDFLRPRH